MKSSISIVFVRLYVIIITYLLQVSLFLFFMYVLGCVHWGVCMEKPASNIHHLNVALISRQMLA